MLWCSANIIIWFKGPERAQSVKLVTQICGYVTEVWNSKFHQVVYVLSKMFSLYCCLKIRLYRPLRTIGDKFDRSFKMSATEIFAYILELLEKGV